MPAGPAPLWTLFDKHPTDKDVIVCAICDAKLSSPNSGTTTGYVHLENVHGFPKGVDANGASKCIAVVTDTAL